METISINTVQSELDLLQDKEVYIHLETTNGAYASHNDEKAYNVGAFIRNAKITYNHSKIVGEDSSFRIGLKLAIGWVYAEGLSVWEKDGQGRLLMAGHDREGRLMVALQIGETPFNY
ncbi:YojF family protein [Radiobacillus sp. PE A8.2]|uniref:YojF family protein n=1 Tax=Radiobacillus sp. PE A8.2 TaxID=3380349 RepID=UPI003890116B